MPRVAFTPALARFLPVPSLTTDATSVRAALDRVFAEHQRLRGYVLDDQSHLRANVVVFIDGVRVCDRESLADALRPDSQVYVMQALSGG